MAPLAALVVAAVTASLAASLSIPPRVLDAHVHLTNTSLFKYSGWANASAGVCPCAAPCLCNWTVADWRQASVSYSPSKFVFIEVDADDQYWLDEVAWVQAKANAGESAIGAIVGKAPPGFGTPAVSDAQMAMLLDKLAALPLVHGLRTYVDLTNQSNAMSTIAHTRLLAQRSLTLEICLGGAGGNAAAISALNSLVAAVPAATFILDHLGSPPVLGSTGEIQAWTSNINSLAQLPNVYVKVGGLFQYYKPCLTCHGTFPAISQATPIVTLVIQSFGFNRCIWEANWFFANWYDPADLDVYGKWTAYTNAILANLSPAPTPAQLDALFFGTGAHAYRVAT